MIPNILDILEVALSSTEQNTCMGYSFHVSYNAIA